MPRSEVRDVQHATYTDDTIPKLSRRPAKAGAALIALGGGTTDRDLALARALVALRDNGRAPRLQAFEPLHSRFAKNPGDVAVASQLAQLYDRVEQEARACAIYDEIIKTAFPPPAAANNWGTCLAQERLLAESIPVWESVMHREAETGSALPPGIGDSARTVGRSAALEIHAQAGLNIPGSGTGGISAYRAKTVRAHSGVSTSELYVVRNIECLRAELHLHLFNRPEVLLYR